ncbi:tyrosine-type recombinase/integrase [Sphingobium sp. YR768]|uniref:tyrosine-type recombinase/integrase n=1 Tax=Sphingobium sp. YR768 TaxID=1884365 RepID=UPI0008AFA842|nr:hypothetical protein SAMN05518866_1542 [Sphingobium sp. YR768]
MGKDPGVEKVRKKVQDRISADNTFATVAAEFINKRTKEGWAENTLAKAEYLLGNLSPAIGRMPVAEIMPADLIPVLKRVEGKGNLETARRMLQFASQVFRYAVATTRLASDPTRDLKGALIAPKPKHHGAIIDPVKVGELLRAIDGYDGNYVKRAVSHNPGVNYAPNVFAKMAEGKGDGQKRIRAGL